jgi:transcriptional regulator with XRE-family HTH domain
MKELNQAQIAKKIGVTAQAVGKWYRGESFPSYKNLLKLQKATGMSLGQITKMLQNHV